VRTQDKRFLTQGPILKKTYYGTFSSFKKKKEIKESKTPTISFFMLETKHDNSKTTFVSSSIKLSKVAESISFLKFRFMDATKFNGSLNN
jgi:hypothetical protein